MIRKILPIVCTALLVTLAGLGTTALVPGGPVQEPLTIATFSLDDGPQLESLLFSRNVCAAGHAPVVVTVAVGSDPAWDEATLTVTTYEAGKTPVASRETITPDVHLASVAVALPDDGPVVVTTRLETRTGDVTDAARASSFLSDDCTLPPLRYNIICVNTDLVPDTAEALQVGSVPDTPPWGAIDNPLGDPQYTEPQVNRNATLPRQVCVADPCDLLHIDCDDAIQDFVEGYDPEYDGVPAPTTTCIVALPIGGVDTDGDLEPDEVDEDDDCDHYHDNMERHGSHTYRLNANGDNDDLIDAADLAPHASMLKGLVEFRGYTQYVVMDPFGFDCKWGDLYLDEAGVTFTETGEPHTALSFKGLKRGDHHHDKKSVDALDPVTGYPEVPLIELPQNPKDYEHAALGLETPVLHLRLPLRDHDIKWWYDIDDHCEGLVYGEDDPIGWPNPTTVLTLLELATDEPKADVSADITTKGLSLYSSNEVVQLKLGMGIDTSRCIIQAASEARAIIGVAGEFIGPGEAAPVC